MTNARAMIPAVAPEYSGIVGEGTGVGVGAVTDKSLLVGTKKACRAHVSPESL